DYYCYSADSSDNYRVF
nr:immunoglobulin light chain junction region [Macaca mulatta]